MKIPKTAQISTGYEEVATLDQLIEGVIEDKK